MSSLSRVRVDVVMGSVESRRGGAFYGHPVLCTMPERCLEATRLEIGRNVVVSGHVHERDTVAHIPSDE